MAKNKLNSDDLFGDDLSPVHDAKEKLGGGRKRSEKPKANNKVSVYLTDKEKALLDAYVEKMGLSISTFAKLAIMKDIKKR